MTTLAQLRRTAMSLPGTAERTVRSGTVAFTVTGKRFAVAEPDGRVRLHLPAADAAEVVAGYPGAEELTRGSAVVGVRLPLADIDGQRLNHWVRRAWRHRAPERLAARDAAAETVAAGEVGDLPREIGRPATRALAAAGVTTLAQVAARGEAELLAMHGVGPKAVRVLREALADAGHRLAP